MMPQNIENYVIIILLTLMLALGASAVITAARSYAAAQPCEAPEDTGWQPPDLSLCPEDMALWDCIRNAAYRSEAS